MGDGAELDHGVGEGVDDGASDPSLHDAVHACPIRRVGGGSVGEDMALHGVVADNEEERLTPAAKEGGHDV